MSALALQSFGFEGQTVRVLDQGGAPWFVAQDVCTCLEIVNPTRAASSLDEDEKGLHTVNTLGGLQEVLIVSESGLYALIFKSRKPAAVRFRKWVTSVVLPTLRLTGRFELAPANDEEDRFLLNSPDRLERARTELAMIRQAAQLFGRAGGMHMWDQLGWPAVDPKYSVRLRALPGIHARAGSTVDHGIEQWANERLSGLTGGRVRTAELWQDYCTWAEGQGLSPRNLVSFGRAMSALGVEKMTSDGSWCLGVKLVD